MPRKTDSPMIIARYDDRVAGWVGSEKGGRLYGDEEWVTVARAASDAGLEFTLYQDIDLKADINDPNNPAGAFAALAWFAKERIRIKEAPDGMMESLGLLDEPEEVDTVEYYGEEFSEEDRDFLETHFSVEIEGQRQWVPLANISTKETPAEFLNKLMALVKEETEPGRV